MVGTDDHNAAHVLLYAGLVDVMGHIYIVDLRPVPVFGLRATHEPAVNDRIRPTDADGDMFDGERSFLCTDGRAQEKANTCVRSVEPVRVTLGRAAQQRTVQPWRSAHSAGVNAFG